jgi:hypothetical protein
MESIAASIAGPPSVTVKLVATNVVANSMKETNGTLIRLGIFSILGRRRSLGP